MADPLLSSLCRICHINPTKYKCPRCSQQTCSLQCSKRHKVWSSCSGVRDPTVYKPKSQLATPSGIDHDYNFLHSIEHRIERSEKEIVEERGLVKKSELELARAGERIDRRRRKKTAADQNEEFINSMLEKAGTNVLRAPAGMTRNVENATSWSKKQRCMNWQVEWIREANAGGRILKKSIERWPIGDAYREILEEERKKNMSPSAKNAERKRKAQEHKVRQVKKAKTEGHDLLEIPTPSFLQEPKTGAWETVISYSTSSSDPESVEEQQQPSTSKLDPKYHFYLHRPKTQSSYPKVLIPVNPTQSLTEILRNRTVLEFPTIYVFETGPEELPSTFMLERDFVKATGDVGLKSVVEESDTEISDEEEDPTSSGEASSDEDDDEDVVMEDGEVKS
ncbi:Zinc HIT-type protein [Rutstroemia sp. NJR-2017a WRK4]|nr:Zinc HIT-type protein [Rutstroemia sp. NJR-2017a WRK4]